MGLIKALSEATSSALGDQFKEFVSCPTISKNVLIQRGLVNHGKGNKNPSEGVISNGSTIVVPQGMAMMIIENGEIKEFTAEPGTFYFDTGSEPSIFTGGLGKGIIDTFKTIGKRFTYGGQTAKDQRVYYVNLLTITGNKFGSPQPKKITDEKYGMLEVTFFGEYAFKVVDPILLVNSVIGANAEDTVTYEEVVGSQLQSKFVEKLTQAISVVMRKNKVSFGDMGLYNSDISDEMNVCLDESWRKNYGLEVTDVALSDINLTDELVEEGFVREIISKVQTMRKDAGFEVMDHIEISSTGNEKIAKLINDNADEIKGDVLCDKVSNGEIDGFNKEWNINGEKVTLFVKKI